MKRQKFILLLIVSILLVGIGHVYAYTQRATGQTFSGGLEVHFIDVGQGDSIFIRSPEGNAVLIDGGEGNGRALAYLQQIGITELDAVIVTHPHADHIGGLVQVLNAITVKSIWTSGATHTTSTYERLIDAIAAHGIPYNEVQTGGSIPAGDLTFAVLYGTERSANLNNTSLVLRLQYHDISFLFTGDAEKEVEKKLVSESPQLLAATVLKVGHHGSRTSSSAAFVQAVHPTIAVYSAGRNNQYGHPHRETIQTLEASGAIIYGTNVDGTVMISTDGTALDVMTAYDPAPVLVDVPVQPIPDATTIPAELLFDYDPFGPDRDCGDFDTHEAAQAFFIAAGGPADDPHRLDGDNDGEACESLP